MEQLSIDFKNKVAAALISVIKDRSTIDEAFYKFYSISAANCLKLRLGRLENLMPDNQWLRLGRKLQVNQVDRQWNMARTDVFNTIEEDILFCKKYSKAKLCVDECGIGKTFTAKYLAATLPNCFYVDASQGKSITLFTRILAKAIGLDSGGKWYDVKEDIKCYLKMIPNPIVIIDEAGDLTQNTLQEVKELWNATEGFCAWYLMGADGLKYIIDKGIKHKKPGFKEIFSRFSERYTTTVPTDKTEKLLFYRKLITDVLSANMVENSRIDEIARRCLIKYGDGAISGLRRAESLLILFDNSDEINQIENAQIDSESSTETESAALVC